MKFKSKAVENHHRHMVYSDPDFKKEIAKLPNKNTDKILTLYEEYRRIGAMFGIPAVYVDFAHEREWHGFSPDKDIGSWYAWLNKEMDRVQADLDIHIKRKHILELYERIVELRKENNIKPTKYKPPENPQLLYAIFRARKAGKSFQNIFDLYKTKKLTHCPVSPVSNIDTSRELEKFYRRYYTES